MTFEPQIDENWPISQFLLFLVLPLDLIEIALTGILQYARKSIALKLVCRKLNLRLLCTSRFVQ